MVLGNDKGQIQMSERGTCEDGSSKQNLRVTEGAAS